MANQRPIRRGRIPFRRRRGPKRKPQWIDGNSAGQTDLDQTEALVPEGCFIPFGHIMCDPMDDTGGVQRSSIRFLWAGPTDAEHVDQNNVLIERIVGSVQFRSVGTSSAQPVSFPLIRFGVLAFEEIAPGGPTIEAFQGISLWDNESLEDYEWMWLQQLPGNTWRTDGEGISYLDETVHLDIRTRRSLGRQDGVALLASWVRPFDGSETPPNGFHTVQMYPLLRVIQSMR